jgi:hypothetical protein
LPQWTLYIKKTAVESGNPNVSVPQGIKNFCALAPTPRDKQGANMVSGMCRQCLSCKQDSDCPESTVCDEALQCCVSNPCFSATPEFGKWIDGNYTREPQCAGCAADEPYCCKADHHNPLSGYCSKEPCSSKQQVRACSYICEDPTEVADAIMCKANQRCCNGKGGAPQCCSPGYDCSPDGNGCVKDTKAHKCEVQGFSPLTCFGSQVCCNKDKTKPPMCCTDGCAAQNMCKAPANLSL